MINLTQLINSGGIYRQYLPRLQVSYCSGSLHFSKEQHHLRDPRHPKFYQEGFHQYPLPFREYAGPKQFVITFARSYSHKLTSSSPKNILCSLVIKSDV